MVRIQQNEHCSTQIGEIESLALTHSGFEKSSASDSVLPTMKVTQFRFEGFFTTKFASDLLKLTLDLVFKLLVNWSSFLEILDGDSSK